MPFLCLCWAFWALSLDSRGEALTGEQVLGSLLQQLQLDRPPVVDKADVEGMVIPSYVRAQYVALLQHSHASRSRGKRFSQNFRGEPSPVVLGLLGGQTDPAFHLWCERALACGAQSQSHGGGAQSEAVVRGSRSGRSGHWGSGCAEKNPQDRTRGTVLAGKLRHREEGGEQRKTEPLDSGATKAR